MPSDRNKLCHCGSHVKYKHCCGRAGLPRPKARISVLNAPLDMRQYTSEFCRAVSSLSFLFPGSVPAVTVYCFWRLGTVVLPVNAATLTNAQRDELVGVCDEWRGMSREARAAWVDELRNKATKEA